MVLRALLGIRKSSSKGSGDNPKISIIITIEGRKGSFEADLEVRINRSNHQKVVYLVIDPSSHNLGCSLSVTCPLDEFERVADGFIAYDDRGRLREWRNHKVGVEFSVLCKLGGKRHDGTAVLSLRESSTYMAQLAQLA